MNFSVYILAILLFTFILLVSSQETPTNENIRRKKQDFYCSGINKTLFNRLKTKIFFSM